MRLLTLALSLLCSPTAALAQDYTLELATAEGIIDSTATVSINFVNTNLSEVQGYQFGICHDEDILSIDEENVERGEALDDFSFTFESITAYDDGWTVGALFGPFSICTPVVCEVDGQFYVMEYDLLEEGTSDLDFCETLGDPIVTVRLIIDSDEVEPEQENGSISVYPYFLIRGDVDGNGEVSGIIDAIALLSWAFSDGAEPPCEEAVDVDDDGEVEALTDAVVLLEWAFLDGTDPPEPGPERCGGDPTDDTLECDEPTEECS